MNPGTTVVLLAALAISLAYRLDSDDELDRDHPRRHRHHSRRSADAPLITVIPTTNGIIGMRSPDLLNLTTIAVKSGGGCLWRGAGAFCRGECLSGEELIRRKPRYVGRDYDKEEGYGQSCITGSKAYCCRVNPNDETWAGVWDEAWTGLAINCEYEMANEANNEDDTDDLDNQCGILHCTRIDEGKLLRNTSKIVGRRCNSIHLFGRLGQASRGAIYWFRDNSEEVADTWFHRR